MQSCATTEAELPAFEPRTIPDRFHGEVPVVQACRRLFLGQTGDALAAMARLLLAGNAQGARERAHRVRGAAQAVGAARPAGWCGRIEHAEPAPVPLATEWLREAGAALQQFAAESFAAR